MTGWLLALTLLSTEPAAPKEIDIHSEEPPTAQLLQEEAAADSKKQTQSLARQLWRTGIALLVVVGLIYLIGKLALRRGLYASAVAGGRIVQVLERVQVDARNALLVVKIDDEQVFLVGTTDRGLSLISPIQVSADQLVPKKNFKTVLDKIPGLSKEPSGDTPA